MEFLEMRQIKDYILNLVLDTKHDTYVLFIGKGIPKIHFVENYDTLTDKYKACYLDICKTRTAKIEIPLQDNNGNLFTLITLHNKEEYKTILSVLEVVL